MASLKNLSKKQEILKNLITEFMNIYADTGLPIGGIRAKLNIIEQLFMAFDSAKTDNERSDISNNLNVEFEKLNKLIITRSFYGKDVPDFNKKRDEILESTKTRGETDKFFKDINRRKPADISVALTMLFDEYKKCFRENIINSEKNKTNTIEPTGTTQSQGRKVNSIKSGERINIDNVNLENFYRASKEIPRNIINYTLSSDERLQEELKRLDEYEIQRKDYINNPDKLGRKYFVMNENLYFKSPEGKRVFKSKKDIMIEVNLEMKSEIVNGIFGTKKGYDIQNSRYNVEAKKEGAQSLEFDVQALNNGLLYLNSYSNPLKKLTQHMSSEDITNLYEDITKKLQNNSTVKNENLIKFEQVLQDKMRTIYEQKKQKENSELGLRGNVKNLMARFFKEGDPTHPLYRKVEERFKQDTHRFQDLSEKSVKEK